MKKKVGKLILTFVFVFSLVMGASNYNVMAEEQNNNDNSFVLNEYTEKKACGLEVYELIDENGDFMGYYEPYSEHNPEPMIMPRYASNVNWTIKAGRYDYGVNQYTLGAGMKMNVNISQSRTGTSYLTFQNRTSNSSLRFTNTKVTNGWNGTITFGPSVSTALYSFGIENASANTITYTGTYSL